MATLTQLQAWKADVDAGVVALGALIARETAAAGLLAASGAAPIETTLKARRINHLGWLLRSEQARSRFLSSGVAAALGSYEHPALHVPVPTTGVEVVGFKTNPATPGRNVSS